MEDPGEDRAGHRQRLGPVDRCRFTSLFYTAEVRRDWLWPGSRREFCPAFVPAAVLLGASQYVGNELAASFAKPQQNIVWTCMIRMSVIGVVLIAVSSWFRRGC